MSERFDSKLADVESPLVRQLGRYLRWSNVDTGLLKRPKGDWDRQTCGCLPKGVISGTAVLFPRKFDNVESVHSCLGWNRTEVVDFLWLVHFFRWSLGKMARIRAVWPRDCVLIPVRVSWYFFSPERPDRLLGQIIPLFVVWWRLFPGRLKGLGVKLTNYVHFMPRLRTRGAINLPHTP